MSFFTIRMKNPMNQLKPKMKNKSGLPQAPKKPNIANQIFIAIFIFMGITVLYTFLTKSPEDIKSITISDVANAIKTETVTSIKVSGSDIDVIFKDETKGKAKKDTSGFVVAA